MKIVGIILIVAASFMFWLSGTALLAGAHYPARIKMKVGEIADPVVDAISDPALRRQKEKEYERIVDAATTVARELDDRLSFIGACAAAVAVVQTVCGVYLLVRNDRKSA